MKDAFLRRLPLTLAALAATTSMPAMADISLEDASPLLTLAEVEGDYTFQGFDIVSLPDDQWAVVWVAHSDQPGERDYVALSRFDAAGEPAGPVLQVYRVAEGEDELLGMPSMAADQNGDLMVSWGSYTSASGYDGQYYQQGLYTRVDHNDTSDTIAAPRFFPETGGSPDNFLDIAVDADGDYGLAWGLRRDFEFWGTYTAEGTPITPSGYGIGAPVYPGPIAMEPDGTFVMTFGGGVAEFRRYTLDGTALHQGDSQLLAYDDYVLGVTQSEPAVSADSDGFLAIWLEDNANSDEPQKTLEIRGRRWYADGTPGPALLLASRPNNGDGEFSPPSVATDGQGNSVGVWAWQEEGQPTVAGLTAFNGDGDVVGNREIVFADLSGLSTLDQNSAPRVALRAGVMAIAWQGEANQTLYARAFQQDNHPDNPTGGGDGGGSGGGATAPLALLGLILLAWRRRRPRMGVLGGD
ncbi:MAG: hypothetical protein ACJATD_001500 [Alloalcanivorax sp.]|jgi:hypothetical protein